MEADYEGFSIREYTRKIRTVDDSDPAFPRNRKAKPKSKPCKKRSIVEIFAAAPPIQLPRREEEGDDSDGLIGGKRKRTKDLKVQKKIQSNKSKDSDDRKFANKVNNCKELVGEKVDGEKCSLEEIKEGSGVMCISSKKVELASKEQDYEFQIPAILKARRKVCSDKSKVYAPECDERHVSLFSPEDQSSVNDKKTKVVFSDQISADMKLDSMQQSKFQPVVSERWLSHARGKPVLPCVPVPYLSSQDRILLDSHRATGHNVPLIALARE
ncbi:hypothetical protein AALP_AA5G235600 [Arabis alpina]|uniref:Uncharacterized protein n=1 Tax=Arabis alpina TaxID=50452 RepID=A0A087GYZ9_ARAAL|nr:hypothetical protein AALP_AA5G235600 [Arabis alpina]